MSTLSCKINRDPVQIISWIFQHEILKTVRLQAHVCAGGSTDDDIATKYHKIDSRSKSTPDGSTSNIFNFSQH